VNLNPTKSNVDVPTPPKPDKIDVRIELPLLSSASTLDLEIAENRLLLIEENNLYYLDISLPYPVDKEGDARFIKAKHILSVVLQVK